MTRIFSKFCLRFQVPYVTSTLERQSTSMYMLLSHMKSSSQEREKGKTQVKTESITKLNNFTFQWTKALYQNNLKHIAFFFTFHITYYTYAGNWRKIYLLLSELQQESVCTCCST